MSDSSRKANHPGPDRAAMAPRHGRDLLLLVTLGPVAAWLATSAGALQALATLARSNPQWPFDAILALVVVVPLVLALGARRRASVLGAELARQDQERDRLDAFYATGDQWFWEMDGDDRWCCVADGAPEVVRALVERRAPLPPEPELVDDEALAHFRTEICRGRPFHGFRFGLHDGAGRIRHMELAGEPVPGPDGEPIGYRGAGREVTDEVAWAREAARLAERDPLTDLPNRASLRRSLGQVVTAVRHRDERALLLCLDVDRFAAINGSLGEAAGDRLIQSMAERIRRTLLETDQLARIGPDQLAVLRRGVADADHVAELCRRLMGVCRQPFELDGQLVEVTVSIGIVTIADDCVAADELLEHAHMAVHRAKALGRGRACLFESGMDALVRRSRTTEQRLRRAMADGEFELHYQPQVSAAAGRVVGLEALLRWRHPERGLLFPKEFLADAEASGLMVPLGAWVLRTACIEAAAWPEIALSVNLSASEFHHPDLARTVERALDESGLAAERLVLEIPESALLSDAAAAAAILDRLAELRVRVAIDDFGTGYTMLGQLQSFDRIKIDRVLITALERHAGGAAVVASLIELGRSLGLRIAAEGIESPEQQALLEELGCVELQGYLFGRPLESEEVGVLMAGGSDQAGGAPKLLFDATQPAA